MATIPLTKGQVAIVDDADYEWLSAMKWMAVWKETSKSYYAGRSSPKSNGVHEKPSMIYMHRLILGLKVGEEGDHRNGNSLDNRRLNLRVCTHQQNLCNRPLQANNKAGFKGVSYSKEKRKWAAYIRLFGKSKYIGRYETPEEAARAYDNAAIRFFGYFGRLNFPEEHSCGDCASNQ